MSTEGQSGRQTAQLDKAEGVVDASAAVMADAEAAGLTFGGSLRRKRRGTSVEQASKSAVHALRANAGRALLTALGVIIGVAAVIIMISLGNAASATITGSLQALGTNVLVISPGSTALASLGTATVTTLTEGDARAIATIPGVASVTPSVWGVLQTAYQNHSWSTRVQGTYPSIQTIQDYQIDQGGFFTDDDEAAARPVCVLGHTVVQNLFDPSTNPVGQQIRIRNLTCTVIGVFAPRGNNGLFDQDDLILIPYTTAQGRLYGLTYVQSVMVQGANADDLSSIQAQVTTLLRERHHLIASSADDFQIRSNNQVQDTLKKTTLVLTIFLAGVAAVSLIVGGIGIMNIMLVSVTERTREIGIRMAIGARRGDVLAQFLIEAVLISGGGGLIGMLLGALVSMAATGLAGWGAQVDGTGVFIAIVFSVAVGIFFGYYPARKASLLDPIDALRRE